MKTTMEKWKKQRKKNQKYRQTLCKRKISRKLRSTDFQTSIRRRDIVLLISCTYSSYPCEWWMVGVVECLDVHSPSHLFISCTWRFPFVVILPELNFQFAFLYSANQSGCGTVLSIFQFSCSNYSEMQKVNRISIGCKTGIWRTAFDSYCFVLGVRASYHPKIRSDNK